jgi:hypothetical protein
VIISAITAIFMLNEETKRIVALGICILFLGIPMLGYLSGGEESEPTLAEQSENSFTQSSGPTLNIRGSEAGSVFSHSILDIGVDSPMVILANGTSVEWSEGSPVYSENSFISTSGRCSILSNYSLFCSGSNNYGQLGLGNTVESSGYVTLNQEPIVVDEGKDHTCAILLDSSLWCWGRNHLGQIGDDSTDNRVSPVNIDLGSGVYAVAVSAGEHHTCAITHLGDVMCWGYNVRGQLGDGTTNNSLAPVLVNHSTGLRAVSLVTSGLSSCVIFENGSVGCWGNKYTVFSDNGAVSGNIHLIDLGLNTEAIMLDGIGSHTCAVTDNGSMQCWGVNTHGQLGDGTCSSTINSDCTAENVFPGEGDSTVHVNLTSGLTVLAAATGQDSTCALLSDDSLHCWGAQSGEFDNTTNSLLNPHQLTFTDGANVAYTEQDFDGDGIRNLFDTHQTGDSDGDGTLDTDDDYPTNPARWTDCADGQFGRLTCVDASPGYSASDSSLIQTECQPGTFQPFTGQASCLDASAGHYVDSYASSSQTQCPSGYSNSNTGQSSCSPAPAGFYVDQSGGDAGNSNTTALQLSAMSANYSASITGGSDNIDVYSINLSRTTWFTANLTSPAGQNYDLELLNSTYQVIDSSNSSSSSNMSYDEVSTSSVNNSSGMYYIRVSYVSGFNNTDDYNLVIDLRSTSASGLQVGSVTTSINPEFAIDSTPCSPGTWQDQTGSTSCNLASPGHYVYGSGATSQNACTAGYYQPNSGQTGCIIASSGYFVAYPASTSQTAAGPGHYVNGTGATAQTACTVGTYQPSSAQSTCFAANPGYYVPVTGQANQTICNGGTYQPNSGQRECIDADPGHYVPTQGATNQTECALGTYQPSSGQWSCQNAEPGHYVDDVGAISQTACPTGEYQPSSGQTSCLTTSAGYYTNSTGSVNQQPCLPGNFQPLPGQAECFQAEPGYYVDTPGSTSQTPCSAGSFNPDFQADDMSDCTLADTGHYVALEGSIAQEECLPGSYSSMQGQIACDAASPGYYVPNSAADEQLPCSLGTWQGSQGSTGCDTADPGHYVDSQAASMQTACFAGTYNPNTGSVTSADCISADAGSYVADSGSAEQLLCSAGSYQPAPGQSSCIDADFGYHVPSEGATGQIGCSMGSYQGERGGTQCNPAEPGYYVDSHFSSSQTACLAGTYNPSTGSTSSNDCMDAAPGFFVENPGSASQQACELGYYQPNGGWSSCMMAAPGHYVDTQAATAQIACEAGTFNSNSGSTTAFACLDAEPGNYVPDPASPAQIPCEEGSYQNQRQQTECKLASLGYFVNTTGAISQTAAPQDYYIDIEGGTEPFPCPEGRITLVEGSDDVEDCRQDYDGDRTPDLLDEDDDNDGIIDHIDQCDTGLLDWISTNSNDWDQDGCEDNLEDSDDDNDGFLDTVDHLPLDPTEWLDTDGDGVGDNADTDDDGDGIPDEEEIKLGLNPLVADYDNDGYNDSVDVFPFNPTECCDTDGDGYGDNSDDFPSLKYLHSYMEAVVYLAIGFIILGVIGFSVRLAVRRQPEKAEAEDSTHEVRQIGGVEVRVSAEDRMFDQTTEPQVESKPEPQPVQTPSATMFDLHAAEQSMTESMDEPITEQVGMDLTHEAEVQEEALTESQDTSQPAEVVDELDLDSLLATAPPPVPKIEAPPDAQVNEHGQKVWRDDNGDVWVQNPDGSLLKHNVLTGAWDPYEQ